MRRGKLIAVLAIAIVASVCGGSTGDTDTTAGITDTTEGTVTTQEPDTSEYPWVNGERDPIGDTSAETEWDQLSFGNHKRQAPCSGCEIPASDNPAFFEIEKSDACTHPSAYVPNQLIAEEGVVPSSLDPVPITPQLLGNPEATTPYSAPNNLKLYSINTDPIAALQANPGLVAAPNYVYVPAPKWKFGPGDQMVPSDVSKAVTGTPFSADIPVIVVDDFNSTGQFTSGHGKFIEHLVDRLTGKAPVIRDVQLNQSDNTPWPWIGDEWSIAAAVRDAVDENKVAVVNLSLGTYPCDDGQKTHLPLLLGAELLQIQNSEEHDIAFVAAAGNDEHEPHQPLFYPAGFEFVTSVGALGLTGAEGSWVAADFSNIYEKNVWAPGVAIVSQIGNDFFAWSGTSFAAPFYSACLASGKC